jgi:hypothetical protein
MLFPLIRNSYAFLCFPTHAAFSVHFFLIYLAILTIFIEKCKIMKLLMKQFPSICLLFVPALVQIFSSAPCSQTPSIYVISLIRGTKFLPIKSRRNSDKDFLQRHFFHHGSQSIKSVFETDISWIKFWMFTSWANSFGFLINLGDERGSNVIRLFPKQNYPLVVNKPTMLVYRWETCFDFQQYNRSAYTSYNAPKTPTL